jgi:hypothetical protein
MERRVSLSIEYGAKAVYAWVIGLGAAAAPAPLSIYSAVRDLGPLDLSSDQRIVLVSALDDGTSIIETPRYRAFTDILRYLATSGRNLVEIAGNDDVLVTVVARGELPTNSFGATQLFAVPVQSKPGWRRLGLDVKVVNLLSIIRQIQGSSIELEHVYDY